MSAFDIAYRGKLEREIARLREAAQPIIDYWRERNAAQPRDFIHESEAFEDRCLEATERLAELLG